jgi:hypothetical protein
MTRKRKFLLTMTCDNNKGNICVICVIKEFPCEIKDLAREEDLYD